MCTRNFADFRVYNQRRPLLKRPIQKEIVVSKQTQTRTPCRAPRAAEILGITQPALYMAVARKQVPFKKFGKKLLFFEEELIRFLDRQPGVDVEEALRNE